MYQALSNYIVYTKYKIYFKLFIFFISDKLNQLEIESIDLLKPIGDIISLERELKRLIEVESNYMNILKNNENNINPQEPI